VLDLPLQTACRLSGEPLEDAAVLLDLPACPLPGIYPPSADESTPLRSPLRVVQAPGSGFVQLAHRFDDSMYADYGFAGNTSTAYRNHMAWFAGQVAGAFDRDTPVLEVGCGDGLLLGLLEERGFGDRLGVDPGRAAASSDRDDVVCGFFPDDLPPVARQRQFGLIVLRHVLEHIEAPREFVAALAARLAPGGQLWIEVPDLDSTLAAGIWSNFYQLHCNYFSARTLDRLGAEAGLECARGDVVDVFGGSILRRYRTGSATPSPAEPDMTGSAAGFGEFGTRLRELAGKLPAGAVGYGAAERTAMALGMAPELASRLEAVYDGNALLHGRYIAGTSLEILPSAEMAAARPPAVVLFALSHRDEILTDWRERLPGETIVAIAGGDCPVAPLEELAPRRAAASG
jgi:SAM-dependent methyltransferase